MSAWFFVTGPRLKPLPPVGGGGTTRGLHTPGTPNALLLCHFCPVMLPLP